MALTQVNGGMLDSVAQQVGFRNRIINGAMMIDQRNAGASVTPTTSGTYTLDRWRAALSVASKYSVQQSTTAPTGYKNSLLATSTSAYTVGASETFVIQQYIEGLNWFDLAWGTASASPVTLSFQVRSSLTGTFGGSFRSLDGNNSYPFTYTISSANTWEQKSITIPGATSGTWATDNTTAVRLSFSLGTGASLSGTANTWLSGDYPSATGATSVVGTNGATFYITGVQLEKGSTATSFDYRPYGTELQLCYRYYQDYRFSSINNRLGPSMVNTITGDASRLSIFSNATPMRVAPTITAYATDGVTTGVFTLFSAGTNQNVTSINQNSQANIGSGYVQLSGNVSNPAYFTATYSAEL